MHLPELLERTGPLLSSVVARIEIADDHNDEFLGVDVLVRDFLYAGLGDRSYAVPIVPVVIERLARKGARPR